MRRPTLILLIFPFNSINLLNLHQAKVLDGKSPFQVLDSEFTDDNRKKCAEAAKPLLQAVEVLSTFASSPEFASVPAKISDKVRTSYSKQNMARRHDVILA